MLVPMDSINISATPSLSFILKHTTHSMEPRSTSRPDPDLTQTRSRPDPDPHATKRTPDLHSTVQRAKRVALNLLEDFLIQQHLHTRVISW